MEIIKSEPGYLTILTGKTDMGKSTITVYDCSEFLQIGKKVIFFSYEYCQSIIYNKLISHFKAGWPTLFNLNIVDASGISLHALIEMIRAKRDNVDIVYIDYLDLLRNCSFDKPENELEDLKQIQLIVKELAKLAKELNIQIILLSQTGSSTDFEETVERLNAFTEKVEDKNTIKMFIGKGNIIDSRINYEDIAHLILIDGYDLKHFSSINIKEIYKS